MSNMHCCLGETLLYYSVFALVPWTFDQRPSRTLHLITVTYFVLY